MANGSPDSAEHEDQVGTPRREQIVRDALLVVLTVASGVIDALSFLGLGQVFTANMTGNLVLLGISAARGTAVSVAGPATAVGGFLLGVLAVDRPLRRTPAARLWPLGFGVALGIVLILETGVSVAWVLTGGAPQWPIQPILVATLGAAMGIQTTAVRALSVSGVTTTFVTGTLASLVRVRAGTLRRLAVVAGLAAGAAAGTLLLNTARLFAPALAPALVALVLAATWLQSRSTLTAAKGLTSTSWGTSRALENRSRKASSSPARRHPGAGDA